MNTRTDPPAVDPVTVEIIRNGLYAVTEEMKTNLTRTAYNLIIYEALLFRPPRPSRRPRLRRPGRRRCRAALRR